jgi:hypothetical protein
MANDFWTPARKLERFPEKSPKRVSVSNLKFAAQPPSNPNSE